jgi:uncharacterized membrane protein
MKTTGRTLIVVVVLAVVLVFASVAFAIPDEFGGGSFNAGFAPYTEAASGYAPGVPERVGNYLVR